MTPEITKEGKERIADALKFDTIFISPASGLIKFVSDGVDIAKFVVPKYEDGTSYTIEGIEARVILGGV